MRVAISQSMLFPWVGLLEQIRLADVFVHYDDVQFSKGSFVNRVQLKTPGGATWLTIPTQNLHLGQVIRNVEASTSKDWRSTHQALLARSLGEAPYFDDARSLLSNVYANPHRHIGAISRSSMLALAGYFGLSVGTDFIDSESLGIAGSSSQRVLDIVRRIGATEYITGHGAARYLDHELFDSHGIRVMYMQYRRLPYTQLHGEFNPHVSALDLVANCGPSGVANICSEATYWRDFLR